MIDRASLPSELHPLFPGAAAGQYTLSTPLPPGRLIVPAEAAAETGSGTGSDARSGSGSAAAGGEAGGGAPVMWLSDGPAPAGLWQELQREHPRSGLWPLLLTRRVTDPRFRPWATGELHPARASSPASHDPWALLRGWWNSPAVGRPDDPGQAKERDIMLEPFGVDWPGPAPSPAAAPDDDPDAAAAEVAHWLLHHDPGLRIGLVRADSGAEALAVCGWSVAGRRDPGELAAVVLSWERRFGARVVEVGPDGLRLSTTVRQDDPDDLDGVLPIAAEHVAFCPDNVFKGTESLIDYAQELVLEKCWSFWWH
ncbi:DUF4253 domain-containing protein [Kitasatospora sp. NPDC001539]|uniref:DUF4253 domain-containing protein n=1 Tax=Kitasatospora sp. NPDC001539 TaxID=3154384 RepID=UPI00331D38DB